MCFHEKMLYIFSHPLFFGCTAEKHVGVKANDLGAVFLVENNNFNRQRKVQTKVSVVTK